MTNDKYTPLIDTIKDMLHTNIEALFEFEKFESEKDFANSLEMLMMCQQSFQSIISVWRENFTLPKAYDNLFEKLTLCLEALKKHPEPNIYSIATSYLYQTSHYLIYFAENIEREIAAADKAVSKPSVGKKKILFVPYKSSMWDSMDSIYEAAINDENCEVYVAPAPYYTLKNEKLEKYCYEGYDLPQYVKITHWLAPDFREMNFDVIYFHNPYDSHNFVTRLHTDFHGNVLRTLCKKLIFAPYAIGIESFDDFESAEHIYALNMLAYPATKSADLILCNSKTEMELLIKRGYDATKLLQASPKLDYGFKIIKEHQNYPPEWDKKIKDKKVFLLGLNIGYIYSAYNPAMTIIEAFLKDSTATLIFRPHPFTGKFLENDNPEQFKHYQSILELIKNKDNIIYDTTPSYTNSFAVADALFNDISSIMPIFMMSEKPVYQYIEPHINKKHHMIDFTGAYGKSNNTSVADFIKLVTDGNDPKKEERLSKFYASVGDMQNRAETDGMKAHKFVLDML